MPVEGRYTSKECRLLKVYYLLESTNPWVYWLHMSDTSIDIVERQDEALNYRYSFALWPRQWATYSESHDWRQTRLVASEAGSIPDCSGVYTLVAKPNIANHPSCAYLMYVGRSISLRRRFGEYLNKERRQSGRPLMFRFLDKYSEHVWFCFTLADSSSLESIESGLRDAYIPPLNDQFTGELTKIVRVL